MKSVDEKIAGLRAWMLEKNLDAVIVPSSDSHQSEYVADHWKSRGYLSGFTGSAGTLVVTQTKAALWTDSRYFLQAEEELNRTCVKLMKQSIPHAPEHVPWLGSILEENARIGIEGMVFSTSSVDYLKEVFSNKNQAVINIDGVMDELWENRPAMPKSEVFIHPLEFAGQSTQDKLEVIRAEMPEADHYLISALDDIAWTLNIRASDIEFTPVAISYLIINENDCDLFIDATRIKPDCLKQLSDDGVSIHEYSTFTDHLNGFSNDCKVMASKGDTSWTVKKILGERLTFCAPIVQELKAVKNEVEIAQFHDVMVKDGIALTKFFMWLEDALENHPTEFELARKLEEFRGKQAGYKGESFAAIVGFKGNGAIVHYKPEEETCATIQDEGMLLVDSGAQYTNCTTDITRTIYLGTPSDEHMKNYTLVLKGNLNLQTQRFPEGTNGMQLDAIARSPLWKNGLNYGHGTGHGVGSFLRVHEPPQGFATSGVTSRGTTEFKVGMVTSNEPGYYKTGEYGIRIENLMVSQMADDGFLEFEALTLFPISTELIDLSLMTESEIEWLNQYHQTVQDRLIPHLNEDEQRWMRAKCVPIEK